MLEAELTIGRVTYKFRDSRQAQTALEFFECFRYAFRVFGFAHAELWLRDSDRQRFIEHIFVTPADVHLRLVGSGVGELKASKETVDALVERFEAQGCVTVPDFEDIVLGIEVDREHD